LKQRLQARLKAPKPASQPQSTIQYDIEAHMQVTYPAPASGIDPPLFFGDAAFKVLTSPLPNTSSVEKSVQEVGRDTPFASPEYQRDTKSTLQYGPKKGDNSRAIAWIHKKLGKMRGSQNNKDLSPRDLCPV